MVKAAVAVSRTQAQKSAETRERLLEATIACLIEFGYARTTTVEVTERAGVSRGAMLHHYPSKAELVTAAVEHLAQKRITEFRDSIRRLPPTVDVVGAAIDLLWENFASPSFYALLELAVAARTDRDLFSHLAPLVRRYERVIAETARELFGRFAPSAPDFEFVRQLLYYFMQGLALNHILEGDSHKVQALLDRLKEEALRQARHVFARRSPPRREKRKLQRT